jgi:hypothetical protein
MTLDQNLLDGQSTFEAIKTFGRDVRGVIPKKNLLHEKVSEQ